LAVVTAALLAACTSSGSSTTSTTSAAAPESSTTRAAPTAATGSATGAGSGIVDEILTPILASVSTAPTPVTGSDGKEYLAYELYVTNATSTPVTIDSVTVTGDGGDALQTYSGEDLFAHSRIIGADPTAAPSTAVKLRGGQLVIFWLDPSVADAASVPKVLQHKVDATFDEAPNPLIPATVSETVAVTPISSIPAPAIASPLAGEGWLNGNGCCAEVTAHRGSTNPINGQYWVAERFAIDWVQLTADGTYYTGDPTQMASYAYYDAPIYAVADGKIVLVSDVLPDEPPGENPPVGALTLTEFGGNHVVQKFEQNGQTYYAFYAHLTPGSASQYAKVGQQVKAGDQLGLLGNSGNSSAPHLHFHVMDSPNPLASNGLPYEFESFTLTGAGASTEALNEFEGGAALALASGGRTGEITSAMPLYLDVLELTAGG